VFVKPAGGGRNGYWLVVDTLTGGDKDKKLHRYESLFHFDADEAEIDPGGCTVRTVDPSPNCLIAAAPQPRLKLRIVKGQTEPAVQGFVAARKWRPSWKNPKAQPPEHGKREVPTAVFELRAPTPARLAYVIYPYPRGARPRLAVRDVTAPGGPVRVRVTLPDGTLDEIHVDRGAKVMRTPHGAKAKLWAEVRK